MRPPAREDPAAAAQLETHTDLASIRAEWTALASRGGNLFGTWEWADAWWRHLGADRELAVRLGRDGEGRATFVLPLYRERRLREHAAEAAAEPPAGDGTQDPAVPSRGDESSGELHLIGRGDADHLGPVCAPADRPAAAAALRHVAVAHGPLVADDLPGDEGWPELLGATPATRTPTPLLRLTGLDWEAFLAGRSRNFRSQVRARERRLLRAHDTCVRLADVASLDADMATLAALHDARWSGRAGTFRAPRAALHRDWARTALERGWLALRLLECEGRPVAALYAFRYAGAEWYYQAGRDPAWDRWSPGFVLLCDAIRAAFADGLDEYRLLRGGESYKSRFADADPGVVTLRLPAAEGDLGAPSG